MYLRLASICIVLNALEQDDLPKDKTKEKMNSSLPLGAIICGNNYVL